MTTITMLLATAFLIGCFFLGRAVGKWLYKEEIASVKETECKVHKWEAL